MNSIRIHALSIATLALASCASQKADQYDTAAPYGVADQSQVNAPASEPNPIYDTPAAYEETTQSAPSHEAGVPANESPNIPLTPSRPAPPAPSANGAAIIHTVVAGDTLSGISAKYKVPVAAIKQANQMTRDIVVLGKKMVIPPVR